MPTQHLVIVADASGGDRLAFSLALLKRCWNIVPVEPRNSCSQPFTLAMLAQVVEVPVSALRRWLRRGYLQPVSQKEASEHHPDYLDFTQFEVAKRLAALSKAGVSLSRIDQLVAELIQAYPDVEHPLSELPLVVDGGRLLLRHENDFAELSGQRLIGFESPSSDEAERSEASLLPYPTQPESTRSPEAYEPDGIDDLRLHIYDHLGEADLTASMDAARRVLVHPEATAEDQFVLAELLYRDGDLSAARERYYVALEVDELYVEARVSLGCVLAELGEAGLAIAAFEGVLSLHEPYADAHYHLARLLDHQGEADQALQHWRRLVEVCPNTALADSPWLAEAQLRLSEKPQNAEDAEDEVVATSLGSAQSSRDSGPSSGVGRL